MKRTLTWALAFVALANSSVAAEPATNALPAAGDVIRRFIERAAQTALPATPGAWVYFRTNLTEEFNSRDKLSKREELLLKVTDRTGEKEIELLAFNGREPTVREQEQAQKRFGQRSESTTQRDRPDRSRQMHAYFTQEILGRYVFTVTGRETIDGRSCLRLSFRPGADDRKSSKTFERVLDRLGGTLWLNEADYELVKADIQLQEKVSMWGGLLGGLEQLRLQIQRTRELSGQWRDQSIEARFVGRTVTKRIDVRTRDFSSPSQPIETASGGATE